MPFIHPIACCRPMILLGFIAIPLVSLHPTVGVAEDSGLIWKPSKLSNTSYEASIGLAAPDWTDVSGGVQIGLESETPGGRVRAPVAFWARIVDQSSNLAAIRAAREVNFGYATETGVADVAMSQQVKQILTDSLDIEVRRHLTLQYDRNGNQVDFSDMEQSLKLTHVPSGAAFGLQVSAEPGLRKLRPAVTLEKRFSSHLKVVGTLSNITSTQPNAAVRGRYSIRW